MNDLREQIEKGTQFTGPQQKGGDHIEPGMVVSTWTAQCVSCPRRQTIRATTPFPLIAPFKAIGWTLLSDGYHVKMVCPDCSA